MSDDVPPPLEEDNELPPDLDDLDIHDVVDTGNVAAGGEEKTVMDEMIEAASVARKKKEKKSPMARKSPLAAGGVANTQQRVGGTPVSREAFPESDEENFLPTTTTVGLKAQHHSNIFVGMNVLVFSRHKGIVRFVGPTHYSRKGKVYVGVEMSERKHGLNSGIVKGCRYFECKDGHGRIVAAEDVKAAGNNRI